MPDPAADAPRLDEPELRHALAYCDSVIDTLREPFLVLDADLRVVTANRSFYRAFQVTAEETQGRFVYDLGDGQWDIPVLRTLLEDVLPETHTVRDFGVEHDFPGVGWKSMLLNAHRFPPDADHPDYLLLAVEDVTDRRRAEAVVRGSEARYRRLFESARDGILILDAESLKITDANPYMTELLGYSRKELFGKELWQIGFFGDKAASQEVYRRLQADRYVRYDHLPLETRAGKTAEVEFVSNVYLENGRHVAQCNIRDIGERSRLERKTHEQAEALADLHRRKDEFLAMLSHELRNPLAPIANAVSLLRLRKDGDPAEREATAVIDRQVGQLSRLVDDLLEVSRITSGRVRLRLERVVLGGVVGRAAETVRPLIDRLRHDLTVSLPDEPVLLLADPSRLEQVVVNLLTNAAKYTGDGGRIGLTVRREGGEAVLRVRDTGVGIAPDLLPRIFDLFTQAERSLDRSQGGLGIGLALVQRLVEMHGGTVEVYSALGHGSEFVVRLPALAEEPFAAPQPPAHDPDDAAVADRAGTPLRVLVVDDNADAAKMMGMLMRADGHEVRTAHDGPSALGAALAARPDVILLDIGLPGMTGFEVAERMRREPSLAGVTLVALTGYGTEGDRRRSQQAGFDHHLVKPASFETVRGVLAGVSGKAT